MAQYARGDLKPLPVPRCQRCQQTAASDHEPDRPAAGKRKACAKRQRTWFRRQHQPHWLRSADPLNEAMTLIKGGLV